MKPLHWDAINPATGAPFLWGDFNIRFVDGKGVFLEPGDEGYVPYGLPPAPPPQKTKPFRRKAKASNQHGAPDPGPTTTTTMPAFKYKVAPNPNGGFTTRPVLGTLITGEVFIEKMAALTGLTTPQCETAFDAVFDIISGCTSGCDHATNIRNRLRFRPTSGGTSPTPDGFQNALEINADIAISVTSEKRDDWRSTLTLDSMGEVGKVSPTIDSIISQENGIPDVYIPGTMEVINGDYTDIDKADPLQGVFVRSGNNPEVRITIYGTITPTSLSFFMPANLTGPLIFRLANFINGSIRSFTYMTPVTQSA